MRENPTVLLTQENTACAGVDVKSMARRGRNCRRPSPSFTRVIFGHQGSHDRWIRSASSRQRSMHELFGVQFVDGVLDDRTDREVENVSMYYGR